MIEKKSKLIILLFSLMALSFSSVAQTQNKKTNSIHRTKLRYFELGIGLPSITIRDRVSTALAYSGFGLASIHIANTKQDANKTFKQYSNDINIMKAKPAIANLPDWNKSANIVAFNFMYRKLKGVAHSKNNQWHYFAGGSLSLNGQLAIIPTANNSLAYNFNWLQAGVEGMIKRDFQWKKKNFQFTYQASLPVLGITVRPQSYIGLPPQSSIWGQDISSLATMFASPKFSSVHNNFIFRNDVSLDMQLPKNKLRLQYFWQFTSNTVAVNSLNSVLSSINIAYLIKLKNK